MFDKVKQKNRRRFLRQRNKAKKLMMNGTSKLQAALIDLPLRTKPKVDIANHHCNKGSVTVNTVRAKEKILRGCQELIRI
ncbi:hypothetical protein [Gallibacterium sp. ZY190522]